MVANDLVTLLKANLPDSHDFPPAGVAPGLRDLDAALRCGICGEMYDAPMILNCGHSFCSLCIRRSLSHKQECPTCRHAASETNLRRNTVLESAVKAWNSARDFILQLLKQREELHTSGRAHNGALHATAEEEGGILLKRKRRPPSEKHDSSDDEVQIISRSSRWFPTATKAKEQVSRDGHNRGPSNSSTPKSPNSSTPYDGLVDCPMCQKRVTLDLINQHMDSRCSKFTDGSSSSTAAQSSSKGKQKQEWSKLLGGTPSHKSKEKERSKSQTPVDGEYLPKVSYHTIKDKRLQELLHEEGLPTGGDRNARVERHQKWVMMYNANVDRAPADRRPREQLRRELRKWEEELRAAKKNEVTDAAAYQVANKAEFANLVEAARPKKPMLAKSRSEAGGVDMEKPISTPDPPRSEAMSAVDIDAIAAPRCR